MQSWRDVPAVPSGAFKELALRSFAAEAALHVFRTSGTSVARRGELHLDTLALYEASVLPSFVVHVLPELVRGGFPGERPRLRVLAPSPLEAPDSSLSHMFGVLLREFAAEDAIGPSGFDIEGGELRFAGWLDALEDAMANDAPLVLCGTAFAFGHALDELEQRGTRLSLPAGSRVMETGGFKGRARELSPQALYARIEERLSIPPARIVNQYGMTELASQFHDSVLRFPGAPRRKLGPPWARVRLVDPGTGEEVSPGEVGVIVVHDLGNTGSVCAVETADLGRAVEDGFEILGREPGAEARGCSIAADEMLAGPGPP
ncbi:MAG TPA: long-chain fatty acid--CoA ligase [Deltaproteobacteria bacterium]|nr:long-chain fatty acid--CoA ligase [Deltaproteobacteria bacterium]